MRKDDLDRFRHMLDAAKEAASFATGRSREDLDTDRMLVVSLVKKIEIIGEAASRISSEARTLCGAIPWEDIIGMRHHLVHVYFDIDLDVVWDTVTKDIPPLISQLERIITLEPNG